METSTFLSELADNWFVVAMFTFFVVAILWAFRPGSRAIHKDTADIPFRNEDFPAAKKGQASSKKKEPQS